MRRGKKREREKTSWLKTETRWQRKKLCSAESGLKDVGEQPERDFQQTAKNGRRLVYFPQRAIDSRRLGIATNLFYKQRGKSHNCITRAIKSIKDAFGVGGMTTWWDLKPNCLSPAGKDISDGR